MSDHLCAAAYWIISVCDSQQPGNHVLAAEHVLNPVLGAGVAEASLSNPVMALGGTCPTPSPSQPGRDSHLCPLIISHLPEVARMHVWEKFL